MVKVETVRATAPKQGIEICELTASSYAAAPESRTSKSLYLCGMPTVGPIIALHWLEWSGELAVEEESWKSLQVSGGCIRSLHQNKFLETD